MDVHIFLIFLSLTCHIGALRIVDPLITEEIEGIVIYEKSAYIQFTVATPPYTPSALMVVEKLPNCENSLTESYYCPLIHHLGKIEADLRSMITIEQTHRKKESIQPSLKHDCGKITQIFPSLYTDETHFQASGPNRLNTCLDGILINEVINDYKTGFLLNYSNSMAEFDRGNFNPPVEVDPIVRNMGSMIVHEVLNIGGFLHYFAEKTRWEDAVSRCKLQKVLPSSLIKTEVLESVLTQFLLTVQEKGYDFAIPIDDSTISAYWTLPTVDCTFSSNHTKLNILMAIPLVKLNRDWSLHKSSVLPFHREFAGIGYVCYLSGDEETEEYFKFDRTSKTAFKSNGDVSGFLKFSPISPSNFRKVGSKSAACAATVIPDSPAAVDIVRNCQLTCLPERDVDDAGGSGIVVQMVGTDTFYISKARSTQTQVTFECGSMKYTDILPLNGALEVKAGCGCKLTLNDKILEVVHPCTGNTVTFEEVRPVHFQDVFAKSIVYIE